MAGLAGWLERRAVPGAVELKARRVYRLGDRIVKFFPPPSVFGLLRAPRAERSAARHFECLPVPSPRPLLAASARRGGPSALVREHVEGSVLDRVFGRDAAATDALAPFLAQMTRHRVLHGDLHPSNLLWDGARWLLLDVDGVRHRLHSERRVTLAMWARLLERLGDADAVRALHRRWRELAPEATRAAPAWEEVERRARLLQPAAGGR